MERRLNRYLKTAFSLVGPYMGTILETNVPVCQSDSHSVVTCLKWQKPASVQFLELILHGVNLFRRVGLLAIHPREHGGGEVL